MAEQLKEQFRGVVWPREPGTDAAGKPVYRYTIVGMLVTDTPIEGLHPNETVLDGMMVRYSREMGMAGAIERAPKFVATRPLGDAMSVLLSLGDLEGDMLKPLKLGKSRKKAAKAVSDE